jgi:hypothetical protein
MISEMNNVDELFCQHLTEFLQTDIDGSLNFLLSATTIHSLEKYLKTFYTPLLDIDGISFIWDQILQNTKQGSMLLRIYGNLQEKYQCSFFNLHVNASSTFFRRV